ncbi:hypothetical protein D6D01_06831 [Aureobasidium pullulans]|uniref:Uncharacterized protein n=1 Tax=Aureobasidium pullulans TaxID=5580 RepID=A0A4S9KWU7_AURPU|nr:hypothetical protein D6D01_06831 [Aureobasidium pullulans]
MSFLSAILSCFGSNKAPASTLASAPNISGPRCFRHESTGDHAIPLRASVSTPPPYVQPQRP